MGLFDNILNGSNELDGATVQLSYEEEAWIDNSITEDPVSLSLCNENAFIKLTAISGSLYVMEGYAAVEISNGKDRETVMESISSKVGDAYDTVKRWITKIWKAIKKFFSKVKARLLAFKDKIMTFFTSYEEVLRKNNGNFNVSWAKVDLRAAAGLINRAYDEQISHNLNRQGGVNRQGDIVNDIMNSWRLAMYGNEHGPQYTDTPWNSVKTEVLSVADSSVDKIMDEYIRWGEKNYRDAMDLEKKSVNDVEDAYDDIEYKEPENANTPVRKIASVRSHYRNTSRAREMVMMARTSMQLRQRGIQLLTTGANQKYKMSIAAAKKAINQGRGITESSYSNIDDKDMLHSLIQNI